jgi:NAD(P)-dependent dehydrogenase (short-subunit alcohol dehydrogenase family)
MSENKAVIVTGVNGVIGKAICEQLKKHNFTVIGIDQHDFSQIDCEYYQWDFDSKKSNPITAIIEKFSKNNLKLQSLINNAAVQIVKPVAKITDSDMEKTFRVNVLTPFILAREFYDFLCNTQGSIINISSIHSKLTKPNFLAYSVSKSALDGLTRAMSVELSEKIKIYGISPAAVDSEMLFNGLNKDHKKLHILKDYHPAKKIGDPKRIAELVSFLISFNDNFLSGSIIEYDGGIGYKLHDPY